MSETNSARNRFVWMDIPVADLQRAIAFYREVGGMGVHYEHHEGFEFAVLDHVDEGNGACLVVDPGAISSAHGPLVYLNVAGRIRDAVKRVAPLGGKVTQDVHSIGPYGFRALIIDCEGNRLALHSPTDE
ncbi:MAG: VOC family protein [Phycisphaerales bacterium]|jgi:predicted enzyme related to lactoylglutathione lyase|nr:VOC family protein [Phycisphaerales bacterium]